MPADKPLSGGGKSALAFVSALVIVGTVGALRKYVPLSSALLAFCRGVIGAAALGAFALLRRKKIEWKLSGKALALLFFAGAALGVNWMLLFEAFNHTTVATATLCYYLQPTIVLLLSPLLFRERLTAKKLLCAGVALLGMTFVSGVVPGGAVSPEDGRGILFGVGAACFYALVVILNKKLTGIDVYLKTVTELLLAAVALLPYLLATGGFAGAAFTTRTVLLLAVAGVVHTGLVYALYFGGMERLSAQTAAILSYADPVTALLVSAVFLKEPFTVWNALGAALILGAALAGEIPRRMKKQKLN